MWKILIVRIGAYLLYMGGGTFFGYGMFSALLNMRLFTQAAFWQKIIQALSILFVAVILDLLADMGNQSAQAAKHSHSPKTL
jgi:hypothetical protein